MAPHGVEDWVVVDGPDTSNTPSAPSSASAKKRRRQRANRLKSLQDGQAAATNPRAPQVSLEKIFQRASSSPLSRTPERAVFLDTQSEIMDRTHQARPGVDGDVLNTSLEEDVRALQRLLACELAVASHDAAASTRHQPSTPSASAPARSPAGILTPEFAASLQEPDLVLSDPGSPLSPARDLSPATEVHAPFSPHDSPVRPTSLPPRSPVPPMLPSEQDAPSLPLSLILPAQPEATPPDETELGGATAGGGAGEVGGDRASGGAPSNPGVDDGSISVSGGSGGGGGGLGEGEGRVVAHLAAVRSEWGPESLARGVGQVNPQPRILNPRTQPIEGGERQPNFPRQVTNQNVKLRSIPVKSVTWHERSIIAHGNGSNC